MSTLSKFNSQIHSYKSWQVDHLHPPFHKNKCSQCLITCFLLYCIISTCLCLQLISLITVSFLCILVTHALYIICIFSQVETLLSVLFLLFYCCICANIITIIIIIIWSAVFKCCPTHSERFQIKRFLGSCCNVNPCCSLVHSHICY